LWHRRFVTADVTVVFVNSQHDIYIQQRLNEDKILTKMYLKGYTAKRLTDEFLQKSWTKRDVNKPLKKVAEHKHG